MRNLMRAGAFDERPESLSWRHTLRHPVTHNGADSRQSDQSTASRRETHFKAAQGERA